MLSIPNVFFVKIYACEITEYVFLNLLSNSLALCAAISDGIVIAAITPIIPSVIKISARVNP